MHGFWRRLLIAALWVVLQELDPMSFAEVEEWTVEVEEEA